MTEGNIRNQPRSNTLASEAEYGEPRLNLFWRTAIVFVAVTLVWIVIRRLADSLLGADYSRVSHTFRAVLTSLVIIPLIFGARRFLDRRPWFSLGLDSLRTGWRPFLVGVICWLLPAALGLVACVVLGWTDITLQAPIGDVLMLAAGLPLLVFIYEALPEELIFRGYFYRNLANDMPRWTAVLSQAILFTLWGIFNGGANSLERSLLFFMFSIIIGIFRVVSGSVWASIGFHVAFQTVAQFFGTVGRQFEISQPQTLMVFAFGVLPFAVSLSLLGMFYKNRVEWQEREPDLPGQPPHHG